MKRNNLLLFKDKCTLTLNKCFSSTGKDLVNIGNDKVHLALLWFKNNNTNDVKFMDLRNSTIRSKVKWMFWNSKNKNMKPKYSNPKLIVYYGNKPLGATERIKKPSNFLKGVKTRNDSFGAVINLLKNNEHKCKSVFKSQDIEFLVKIPCMNDNASGKCSSFKCQNRNLLCHYTHFINKCYNKLKNFSSRVIKTSANILDTFNPISRHNCLQLFPETSPRQCTTKQLISNEIRKCKALNKAELKNVGCKTTHFRNIYFITPNSNSLGNIHCNMNHHKFMHLNYHTGYKDKIWCYLQSIRNIHLTNKIYGNSKDFKGRKRHHSIKKRLKKVGKKEFTQLELINSIKTTQMDANNHNSQYNFEQNANKPLNRLSDKLRSIVEQDNVSPRKQSKLNDFDGDKLSRENENNYINELLFDSVYSMDNNWLKTLMKLKTSCANITNQPENYSQNVVESHTKKSHTKKSIQDNPSNLTEENDIVKQQMKSSHPNLNEQNLKQDISDCLFYLQENCKNNLPDNSTPVDNKEIVNSLLFRKPFRNRLKKFSCCDNVSQREKVADSLCETRVDSSPQKSESNKHESNNTNLYCETQGTEKDNLMLKICNSRNPYKDDDCRNVESLSQQNTLDNHSYSKHKNQIVNLKSFKHEINNNNGKKFFKPTTFKIPNKVKAFKEAPKKNTAKSRRGSKTKTPSKEIKNSNLHSEHCTNKDRKKTAKPGKQNYLEDSECCNGNSKNIKNSLKEQISSSSDTNQEGKEPSSKVKADKNVTINMVTKPDSNELHGDVRRTAVNQKEDDSDSSKSVINNQMSVCPPKNNELRQDGFKSKDEKVNIKEMKKNPLIDIKAKGTMSPQTNAYNSSVKVNKRVTKLDRYRNETSTIGKGLKTNHENQISMNFYKRMNSIGKNITKNDNYSEFGNLKETNAEDSSHDKEEDQNAESSYFKKEWVTGVERLCNWPNEHESPEKSQTITDVKALKQTSGVIRKNMLNSYLSCFKVKSDRFFNVDFEKEKQLKGKTNARDLLVNESVYERNRLVSHGNIFDGDLRTVLSRETEHVSDEMPKNIDTDKYESRIDRLKSLVQFKTGKRVNEVSLAQGNSSDNNENSSAKGSSYYSMTDGFSNELKQDAGVNSQKAATWNSTNTRDNTIQSSGYNFIDPSSNHHRKNSNSPRLKIKRGGFYSSQKMNIHSKSVNSDNITHNDKHKMKNPSKNKTLSKQNSLLINSSNSSNKTNRMEVFIGSNNKQDEAVNYNVPFHYNDSIISENMRPSADISPLVSKTAINKNRRQQLVTKNTADEIDKRLLENLSTNDHSVSNSGRETANPLSWLGNLVQSVNSFLKKNYSDKPEDYAKESGGAQLDVSTKNQFNIKRNSVFNTKPYESRVNIKNQFNRKTNSDFDITSNRFYLQNSNGLAKGMRANHFSSERYLLDFPTFMPKGKLQNFDGDRSRKPTIRLPESHNLYRMYRDDKKNYIGDSLINNSYKDFKLSKYKDKTFSYNDNYRQPVSKTFTQQKSGKHKVMRLQKHVIKTDKSNTNSYYRHTNETKIKLKKFGQPQQTFNQLNKTSKKNISSKNFNTIGDKRNKKRTISSSKMMVKSIDRLLLEKIKPSNDYLTLKDMISMDKSLDKNILFKYFKNRTCDKSFKSIKRFSEKSQRFEKGVVRSTNKFYTGDLDTDIKNYQKCTTNYLIPFVSVIDTLNRNDKKLLKTAPIKPKKTPR